MQHDIITLFKLSVSKGELRRTLQKYDTFIVSNDLKEKTEKILREEGVTFDSLPSSLNLTKYIIQG
jgi:hypothetical protein